jgi:hypothetical protein
MSYKCSPVSISSPPNTPKAGLILAFSAFGSGTELAVAVAVGIAVTIVCTENTVEREIEAEAETVETVLETVDTGMVLIMVVVAF